MATRGAYGFRVNNNLKITYNHYDSQPTGLGQSIISFLRNTPGDSIAKIAEDIRLVGAHSKPTPEQILECKQWADLGVSDHCLSDWYCLMRKAQGSLDAFGRGLRYMLDARGFIYDTLFCEWAYIVDLSAQTLEILAPTPASQTHLTTIAALPLRELLAAPWAHVETLCQYLDTADLSDPLVRYLIQEVGANLSVPAELLELKSALRDQCWPT